MIKTEAHTIHSARGHVISSNSFDDNSNLSAAISLKRGEVLDD